MQIIFEINSILLFSLFIIFSSWYFLLLISFLKKERIKSVKKLPKVSILIPAYNEEKNIGKCIKNVKKMNYPKNLLEIIVVDDGSSDRTYEIAKKHKVKVYKIKHCGKACALNFGLKKCTGKYVLIIDADTIVDRDFIIEALKRMDKNVVAVSASMDILNEKNIITLFQKIEYIFASFFKKALNSLETGCLYIFGAATIYKTSILKKLKFKNVSTEDFDLAVRIQSKGYRIVQIDKIAKTAVPEKLYSLYKQRIRWYSHALYLFKFYKFGFFKKISSLSLYTLPLTYFWYFFAILNIPLTFYQIYYWIPKDNLVEAVYFIFRWFSFFGTIYNIYMLQFWQINLNLVLGIIVSIQSFLFILLSLIYYKKLDLKTFLASFFMYPYFFFIINFSLILSIINFLRKS
jgi:cellulose synthase/poly-beta-1,6-N-acetylglucosamine synthase-like glycosyltransferase